MQDRKMLDRREFTVASAMAVLSGVAITISGCGGTDSSSSTPTAPSTPAPPPPASGGDVQGTVSANHGHIATLTGAQLTAGGMVALDIMGGATHSHTVELSEADIAAIAAGATVAKTTTMTNGHTHNVTFN